jgi:hypothetical protein
MRISSTRLLIAGKESKVLEKIYTEFSVSYKLIISYLTNSLCLRSLIILGLPLVEIRSKKKRSFTLPYLGT